MDLIETVGARLVLMGRAEYVAGLADAKKAVAELGATAKEAAVGSDALRSATVTQQAAMKTLADSTRLAVAAQQEFDAAQAAVIEAERAATVSADEAAAAIKREADARLAAATVARDSALTQMKASEESAAAATASAEEVSLAEKKKAAAADLSNASMKTAAFGVVAVAAVAAGVSVKMAADFQASTERLVTSAGETQSNLNLVRDGILSMAGQVGYSAEALSAAMYKVESGGQHGADGLIVLKAAAEGAKTENANLTTVSDALTSALTDYHLPATAAADVTSKLVAATSAGKMTFEELAGSMSAILPIASANHVSLNDILSDLASMTMHGMSAQQATQNLANAVRNMSIPNSVAQKELALLGLTAQQVSGSLSQNGLSGTINMIGDAITKNMGPGASKVVLDLKTALNGLNPSVRELGQKLMDGTISQAEYSKASKALTPELAGQAGQFATLAKSTHAIGNEQMSGAQVMQTYTGALGKAMGGATGLNVALMIGGENAKNTAGAIDTISKATAQADGHVRGWDEIQGLFNTKLAQAQDGLGALAIKIGTVLLPPLTTLMGYLASGAQWLSQNQTAAMVVAGVIGGVLVIALGAAAAAMWTFTAATLANPLTWLAILIIAFVAIMVYAVVQIVQHWSEVAGFFSDLWNTVSGYFTDQWNKIVHMFQTVVGAIEDFFRPIVQFFVDTGNAIGTGFMVGVNAIATAAQWLWNNILQPVFNFIATAAKILVAVIVTLVVAPIVMALNVLGQWAMFLWENSFKPALEAIGAAAMWLWNTIFMPVAQGIQNVLNTAWQWINANVIQPFIQGLQIWGDRFTWLWQNIVIPVWNGIQNVINTAWQWINSNIFVPAGIAIKLFGDANSALWNNYIVPAWNGIQNAINVVWQWINSNILVPAGIALKLFGDANSALWNNVIVPAWNGIQNAINTVWQWIDKNIFTPFKVGIALLGVAFDEAQKFIGTVWQKIQDGTRTPVKWVIDVVYTGGIKAVWDKVAAFVGPPLGPLPAAPNFAGGGVLGGYAPGVDSIPAVLSPGEAVLVPELVRAIGPHNILAANAQYSGGRQGTILGGGFAGGGLVYAAGGATPPPAPPPVVGSRFAGSPTAGSAAPSTSVGGFVASVGNAVGSIAGTITDFMSDPIGLAGKWLHQVFTDLAGGATTPVAQAAFHVPEKAVDGLVAKVKTWWDAQQAALAAMVGGGGLTGPGGAPTVGGNLLSWIQQAEALTGVGPSWTAGLSTLIMRESGGNPAAINLTDSNAVAGHPSQGLMQTIPGTFAAYHQAGTSNSITDPVANIAAGINYIKSRYGGIGNVQQANPSLPPKGYSLGGIVGLPARATGGPVSSLMPYMVGERGPELFVPDSAGRIVPNEDVSPAGGGGVGVGSSVHVDAINVYGAHDPQACYEAAMRGVADAVARR